MVVAGGSDGISAVIGEHRPAENKGRFPGSVQTEGHFKNKSRGIKKIP
jgi:hypothetical protein